MNDKGQTDFSKYLDLADQYSKKGNHKESIEYWEKIVEIKPDFSAGWVMMGQEYEKLKQSKKAIECYDNALRIDSQNNEAQWFKERLLGAGTDSIYKTIMCFKCESTGIDSKPFMHRHSLGITRSFDGTATRVTERFKLIPISACKKCNTKLTISQKLNRYCYNQYICTIAVLAIMVGVLMAISIMTIIGVSLCALGIYSIYRFSYSKLNPRRYVKVINNQIYVKSENMTEWAPYLEFLRGSI